MTPKSGLLAGSVMPLVLLGGCGGGGSGSVASTPVPVPAPIAAPPPAPTPAPVPVPTAINYDTTEYHNSNGAAQAQAIVAYRQNITGEGVLVGVIDSGVNAASPEFAGKISPLSADYAGSRTTGDEGGHGTAVSEVLLGGKNDSQVHGVAFGATLLVLRTDTPGSCTAVPAAGSTDEGGCSHNDNAIAAALDGAVAARARVVNISLGGSPANSRLRAAIDQATAAGIIIVISAGNDGVDHPANAANPDPLAQIAIDPVARGLVIIAGAVDGASALAKFSNKAGNGASAYLAALGDHVRSIDNTGTPYLYDGTSFSAPVVAGAVALLAQAYPNLTPTQIVQILYRSANDLGAPGVDGVYGNGELNLARAFSPIGQTSLASGAPVSPVDNATLGGAMGDAGSSGLSAAIKDEYARDFDVNLAPTIHRTQASATLSRALAGGMRSVAASGGRTSFAFAIDDRTQDGRTRAAPLLLQDRDAARARVLAGAAATAIGRSTTLGLGFGRGSDGLVRGAEDAATPAFLIADRTLERAPAGAFAVRRALGRGIGMTIGAEAGDMSLWQRGDTGPMSDGWRRYRYGQVAVGLDARRGIFGGGLKLSRMNEDATVLGSRFGAALGGSGATSWFADARASALLGEWRIDASMRRGWTALGASGVRGTSVLATQALSASFGRAGWLTAGDSFALRYAEPLRVTGGGLLLSLDAGPAQRLSLAPRGHERDLEAVYALPIGPGALTANAYLRRQPGHWATAPDDLGAAVRYTLGF